VARSIRVPVSPHSLAGYCAGSQRAFVVPDAYGDLSHISPDLRFDQTWDKVNGFRTRDIMCAPAVFRGELLGVIELINGRTAPFGGSHLAALMPITRLVGYALFHARLYDELSSLKALRKQKASFMRIMVHELKSPVSGSKMLATGLQYAHSTNEPICRAATRIGSRMDELLTLIEDILNLSKIQEGSPLSDIEVLDLTTETLRACEPYPEQAAAKGLALSMLVGDRPVSVRFDQQGYQLVVSNLVSNAIKYTPSGSVSVSLRREDSSSAVLEVVDTGLGIPAADLPKMFQEFFRASNVRGGNIRGTGVGLTGVKEIVERFGGSIELFSQEGQGSTFRVSLPCLAEGKTSSPA